MTDLLAIGIDAFVNSCALPNRSNWPEQWPFDDARLQELFFRYRARNFPETLNVAERQQWESFCRNRLSHEEYGAPNTLPAFEAALEACRQEQGGTLPAVLAAWRDYAAELRQRYSLET